MQTRSASRKVESIGVTTSLFVSLSDQKLTRQAGIDDPHVAASLFKLWLRELEQPLIPPESYNHVLALAASRDSSGTVAYVRLLPVHNRRVLAFVISFLQLLIRPAVVEETKMTAENLCMPTLSRPRRAD